MNFKYITARLIRKYIPNQLFNFLLQKGIGVKPGMETSNPKAAVSQYMQVLKDKNFSIDKKRVLLFGYGGNFGVACLLLEAGASHVTLVDKYAQPNYAQNKALLPQYEKFITDNGKEVIPNPKFITLHHDDIEKLSSDLPIDLVLSNSVLEHVQDVDKTIKALTTLTNPNGIQIHFIDLRDHYFKYPFEMLCYTEKTWQRWLNPSSYLNRYRLGDYQAIFEKYSQPVEMVILERDIEAFKKTQSRIRAEFLTGKLEIDSVTGVLVISWKKVN
jgi:hypothetical protein